MEQRMEHLEIAHQGAKRLANRRSMEKQAQRPQMLDDEIARPANEIKGGGEAGLARVIGAGKRRGRPRKVKMEEMSEMSEMEEEEEKMEGGRRRRGRPSKVKGASDGEMCGGGAHQGKMLGEHLMKLHGKGFFDDFAKGFMSVIKPVASVVGAIMPGPIGKVAKMVSGGAGDKRIEDPQGTEITHRGFAPSQMTPGAIAPMAYGSPPQAPASFQRNTVGMGKLSITHGGDMMGKGKLSITHGGRRRRNAIAEPVEMPEKVSGGGKRSARGVLVSKLMKEKGMSLGQASRYIKEKSLL